MSHVHKHWFACRMLFDKTYCRIGDGSGVIIIIGEFCNSGQITVYGSRFIIIPSSAQATVIFVKTSLDRIATVRSIKSSIHCNMPFAAHISAVTTRLHHFGNSRDVFRNLSSVSGAMFIYCRHPSHARLMLVVPCQ